MHLNVTEIINSFNFFSAKSDEDIDLLYFSVLDGTISIENDFLSQSKYHKILVLIEHTLSIPLRKILKNYKLWQIYSIKDKKEYNLNEVIMKLTSLKLELENNVKLKAMEQEKKVLWNNHFDLEIDYQNIKKYDPYFMRLMKFNKKDKIIPFLTEIISSFIKDLTNLNQKYKLYSNDFEKIIDEIPRNPEILYTIYKNTLTMLQTFSSKKLDDPLNSWNTFISSINKEEYYNAQILKYQKQIIDFNNILFFLKENYILEDCEKLIETLETPYQSFQR